MTKKKVFLSMCDGVTQGIILYLLMEFTISAYADALMLKQALIIAGGLALLSPLSYYFFVLRSGAGKRLLALSAISFLAFVITIALSTVISWGQLLFPMDKLVCFSEGMIQQLEMLVFLAASAVLRLLVLMIKKIKTKN